MAKKPLFFTLRRKAYPTGYVIMAVTTEKRRRYWGSVDGEATNAAERDCHGRFATEKAAASVKSDVEKAYDTHAPRIAAARQIVDDEVSARDAAVRLIIAKGTDRG